MTAEAEEGDRVHLKMVKNRRSNAGRRGSA